MSRDAMFAQVLSTINALDVRTHSSSREARAMYPPSVLQVNIQTLYNTNVCLVLLLVQHARFRPRSVLLVFQHLIATQLGSVLTVFLSVILALMELLAQPARLTSKGLILILAAGVKVTSIFPVVSVFQHVLHLSMLILRRGHAFHALSLVPLALHLLSVSLVSSDTILISHTRQCAFAILGFSRMA